MIPLEQFATYIHPKIPGCPYELIELEVVEAARELCDNAAVWKLESTQDVQAGVWDYPIDTPDCAEPVRVHDFCVGNESWINKNPMQHRHCGCVKFEMVDPTHVRIDATLPSDVVNGARLVVQLRPKTGACELPDQLYTDYRDAIAYGTLYRLHELYASKENPWALPALGRRFYQMFHMQKTRAKNKLSLGHRTGMLPMKGGYF